MLENLGIILNRRENILVILILLLSMLMRLGLILTVTEPIDRDAKEYYEIARNLVAGKGFSIDGITPTARRSPGYPLFLAGIMMIFGANPTTLYLIQALINITTIYLVYLALKYISISVPLRILIAAVSSLSTSFIYVNVLYAEILTMGVVSLLLLCEVHPRTQNRPILKSIIEGFLIGSLIHLRPTFLYLPLFLLAGATCLRLFFKNFPLQHYAITVIIAILTVMPWTIRNYVVFRQYIPLVSAGGGELWGANCAIEAGLVWNSVSDIQKYEQQRQLTHARQNRLISEYRERYHLDKSEDLNRFLAERGKQIILQHPFRYTLLCINRLMIFWFSPPIGSSTFKAISPALFILLLLVKYLLTIWGFIGLWRWMRRYFPESFLVIMMIVYLSLLHAATHAIQRYSLPLLPLMYYGLGYFLSTLSVGKIRSSPRG